MASSRHFSVRLRDSDVKAKAHGSQRPAPEPERVFIISSQQPLSPGRSTKWHALVRVFFYLLIFSLGLLAWGCFNFFWVDSWTGLGHGPLVVPLSDDPAGALGDRYLLGVGKADITGPVVELNLMGYADTNQIGTGLRQRLYSRAFIVGDVSRPADRFVYLVLDTQSGDTAIRYGILSAIREMGPDYQQLYGQHNVAVTGTHSHAGPGGWLNYLLPQITSMGFDHQGYRAIVEGAALSIRRAHESLQPGLLSVGTTRVRGANINRSMFAYLANPEAERARYNATAAGDHDDGSVDKDLTLLKFRRASDGKNIGVLTWFPTHGTSLLGNNTLVAGDNKGVAAYLFEKSMRDDAVAANAAEGFVAGFSQTNVGDTSPNVLGAWCDDGSGQMCSLENSTCLVTGKAQACHGRGPMFRQDDTGTASCFEIGKRQFEPARALYDALLERDASSSTSPAAAAAAAAAGQAIRGSWVKSFHWFHNMSGFEFVLPNGSTARTCPAALGYGFAGGTSDWPGHFDFTQHDGNETTTSPVWRAVSHLLKAPSAEQRACHGAKSILLDVGEVSDPYEWTPNVSDVQMFRVGQLLIIVSPGEATTMAGRRWKEAVGDASADMFRREYDGNTAHQTSPVVVLGGPANSYTHYIATEEEYAIQRYEGASTLYGPHTLAAYINVTLSLLSSLAQSDGGGAGGGLAHLPPHLGPSVFPPDNSNRSLSFVPGVFRDGAGLFRHFGDVVEDVEKLVYDRDGTAQPKEPLKIRATFVGANPRNNLRLEGTFAAVERLVVASSSGLVTEAGGDGGDGDGSDDGATWQTVRDDGDWSLVYRWRRTSGLLGTSEVDIEWEVEDWAEAGTYRLRYYGDAKSLGGKIEGFEGASRAFTLV